MALLHPHYIIIFTIFLWFSYGFIIFPWFSHGFPTLYVGIPAVHRSTKALALRRAAALGELDAQDERGLVPGAWGYPWGENN